MSFFSLPQNEKRRKLAIGVFIFVFAALISLGAMAKNGWLPHTDGLTGKRTGWFGSRIEVAVISVNPTPTPQLSKELIYAGDRLLTVEDANASAVPPADLSVWRPSTGWWFVRGPDGNILASTQWGTAGDIPVAGDYDGDGKTDFSVFRPSTYSWYVLYSSNGSFNGMPFGTTGDKEAPADFDGDGKTDVAVFRPGTPYTWIILKSSDGTLASPGFGTSGDKPAPADYDGDGKADVAVWRPSDKTFYVLRSSDGQVQWQQITEATSDIPVSFDYDGDGRADYAIYNSTGTWHIRQSTNNQLVSYQWGMSGDKEVPNDYDADGKVDLAVWRGSSGYWYIRQSSRIGQTDELRSVQWGQQYDIPVPVFYRR